MNRIYKNTSILWCVSIPLISGYFIYNYYTKNNSSTIFTELDALEKLKMDGNGESETESNTSSDDDTYGDEIGDNDKINLFCHYFNTTYKLEHGLKNKSGLPELEVGLFDMGFYNNHSMWMKDTLIPLDIIFLDREYNVVGVIHNTEPLSERSLFVNKMSYYIIETNSGFCNKYNIESGMNMTDEFNLVTIQ
jgi:uncharacterized membrane protein (UPF0127 family)